MFAAIYVLTFHIGVNRPGQHSGALAWSIFISHGYLAVSFFFILSGFVLCRAYRNSWTLHSYGPFIVARLARLYPVYVVALLIQAPFYFHHALLHGALCVVLLVQSWTVLPSDFPGAWNFPAWTLSVEWFFYLIFPGLLWVLARIRRKRLAIAILLIAILALDVPQAAIGGRLTWFNRHIPLPLLRLPEFFLGMVVATIRSRNPLKSGRWTITATSAALLLLSLNIHRFVTLVDIAFAAMIWLFVHEESAIRRWLELQPLLLLGGASYAIYILQDPVRNWLTLWSETWLLRPSMEQVGYPFALILFSVAIFLWVEQPARKWIRASLGKPYLQAGSGSSG